MVLRLVLKGQFGKYVGGLLKGGQTGEIVNVDKWEQGRCNRAVDVALLVVIALHQTGATVVNCYNHERRVG